MRDTVMHTPYRLSAALLMLRWLAGQPAFAASGNLSMLARTAFEEPLVETGPTSRAEAQDGPDDFRVFDVSLAEHPASGWRVALLTNLGLSCYHYGYFSKAMAAWEQAWQSGRGFTAPRIKALVDLTAGELVRMHARLGHAEPLESLFRDIGEQPITESATEAIQGAREALWLFRNQPGVSYLCDPRALRLSSFDEAAMDDGSYSPDRPFVIYFLGPFFGRHEVNIRSQ